MFAVTVAEPDDGTEPTLVVDVVAAAEKAGLLEVSPSPGSVIEDSGTVTITVLGQG